MWQNSWGCTTRTIGVMVMVHSDDRGLVLPPRVAPMHVVIVPIPPKKAEFTEAEYPAKMEAIITKAREIAEGLKMAGLKAHVDDNTNYNPGHKFNHWELRGVPLRFEVGCQDLAKGVVTCARRTTLYGKGDKKEELPFAELPDRAVDILEEMQAEMYNTALGVRDSKLAKITEWKDFNPNLGEGKMILCPFCGDKDAEEEVKENSKIEDPITGQCAGAKSLCIPFKDPVSGETNEEGNSTATGLPCVTGKGRMAKYWTLFGRSY